jgi:preprotein translocase YajC subunit
MMGLMVVMFYFLLIRPQQRQRKEQAARIAALQAGDKVVTTAGIHGIVHNVKEHTVVVKVAEGTMIEFDKMADHQRPQEGRGQVRSRIRISINPLQLSDSSHARRHLLP